ncbi:MAG TPA: hypothetical protein VHG32_20305 [Thermoanaerobaculia bacterium]|nr:hypothetical protein [Thermoanaerobaculia bacterium]
METSSKVALYKTNRLFLRFEIGIVIRRKQSGSPPYLQAQQPPREGGAQPVLAFSAGAPKPQALAPEMGVVAPMALAAGTAPGTSETTIGLYADGTGGKTGMPPPDPPGPPSM